MRAWKRVRSSWPVQKVHFETVQIPFFPLPLLSIRLNLLSKQLYLHNQIFLPSAIEEHGFEVFERNTLSGNKVSNWSSSIVDYQKKLKISSTFVFFAKCNMKTLCRNTVKIQPALGQNTGQKVSESFPRFF